MAFVEGGKLTDAGVSYVVSRIKQAGWFLTTCATPHHGRLGVKYQEADGTFAEMNESGSGGPLLGDPDSITGHLTEKEFIDSTCGER